MPKAVFLVSSRPVSPDKDADFNAWYDEVHLPDLRSVPGVVSATRYRLAPDGTPGAHPYLTVYEIEADDPTAVVQEMTNGVREGRFVMSDTIETDPMPLANLYLER